MRLQRFKHAILRLSAEEKAAGIGGLLILLGSFMPWYSVTYPTDQGALTENGFSGDLGVMGFVIFLITAFFVLMLVSDTLRLRLPRFGFQREQVLLFLSGQVAFLTVLTVAIYTKRSLDFTQAELRFGLYMALIGSILSAFAVFAEEQKRSRQEAQSFFAHPESEEEAAETPDAEVVEEMPVPMPEPEPAPQIALEEFLETEAVQAETEPAPEPEPAPQPKPQKNYFMREAGIASRRAKPPIPKPIEKTEAEPAPEPAPQPADEPPTTTSTPRLDFYDDRV